MQWDKFVVIIIGMSSMQYKHLLSPKGYTRHIANPMPPIGN